MDTSTEAALRAIIKTLVEAAPDEAIPTALMLNLREMYDQLTTDHHPSEARDLDRLARFAHDARNNRIFPSN